VPERIQLRRTRGWRKPPGAVVVARPSRWGNPFPVGPFTREEAVRLYRALVVEGEATWHDEAGPHRRQRGDVTPPAPTPAEVRAALAGRDLACWCPLVDPEGRPVPCHAEILLELANRIDT